MIRIQIVDMLYRTVIGPFETRLVMRDDQIAVGFFHLVDFLLKFHRRAFSWSNLERIDEMSHVHRAPDIRELLEEIVTHLGDNGLHNVLNGMYKFRFRGDIAREIEYVSRHSNVEMAAFNFTLDESQSLKAVYHDAIKNSARPDIDMSAALGELYEFDQEYDTARYYYREAIELADNEFFRLVGNVPRRRDEAWSAKRNRKKPSELKSNPITEGNEAISVPPYLSIFLGSQLGEDIVNSAIAWGLTRLRLMLQIGMTFEMTRNFERASGEYAQARYLSFALINAMLRSDNENGKSPNSFFSSLPDMQRKHILRDLNLVYQSTFAMAWISEKMEGAVDSSLTLMERDLTRFRLNLPFWKDSLLSVDQYATDSAHGNFAIIAANLYAKAGDMYFIKGRQSELPLDFSTKIAKNKGSSATSRANEEVGHVGYLIRAHIEYCLGLNMIQRFLASRRIGSGTRMRSWIIGKDNELTNDLRAPTFKQQGAPSFVSLTVSDILFSLAGSCLARTSILDLWSSPNLIQITRKEFKNNIVENTYTEDLFGVIPLYAENFKTTSVSPTLENLTEYNSYQSFSDWLSPDEYNPQEQAKGRIIIDEIYCGTYKDWLGEWTATEIDQPIVTLSIEPKDFFKFTNIKTNPKRSKPMISFGVKNSTLQRLIVSVNFSLWATRFSEDAGNLADAGRDLVTMAETITRISWWLIGLNNVNKFGPSLLNPDWKKLYTLFDANPEKLDESKNLDFLVNALPGSPFNRENFLPEGQRLRLINYLVDFAVKGLKKSKDLFADKFKRDHEEVADIAPLRGALVGISLGLILDIIRRDNMLPEDIKIVCDKNHREIKELMDYWLCIKGKVTSNDNNMKSLHSISWMSSGSDPKLPLYYDENSQWLMCALLDYLSIRKFPVTNRIFALQTLITYSVFHDFGVDLKSTTDPLKDTDQNDKVKNQNDNVKKRAIALRKWTNELFALSEKFNSMFYNPPIHNGLCAAWVYLDQVKTFPDEGRGKVNQDAVNEQLSEFTGSSGAPIKLSEVLYYAQNALKQSREMVTMGRQYYSSISDLYYLYDDFNDRQFHAGHAQQMAAIDYNVLISRMLEILAEHQKRTPPSKV